MFLFDLKYFWILFGLLRSLEICKARPLELHIFRESEIANATFLFRIYASYQGEIVFVFVFAIVHTFLSSSFL